MKRVRQIVTEINIYKAGAWHHFQIKLPKNTMRVVGIESDVFLKPLKDRATGTSYDGWEKYNTIGKLSLQSMEKINIFYTEWVRASVFYEDIKNQTAFKINSFGKNIRGKTQPKQLDISVESTTINGLYKDTVGKQLKKDVSYKVKIMLWIETTEETNGIAFEFLNQQINS
jgi:hypothetical protein